MSSNTFVKFASQVTFKKFIFSSVLILLFERTVGQETDSQFVTRLKSINEREEISVSQCK